MIEFKILSNVYLFSYVCCVLPSYLHSHTQCYNPYNNWLEVWEKDLCFAVRKLQTYIYVRNKKQQNVHISPLII
jgi:hypothetical protein